ncbi:sel1 repeat family protein [Limosilactobacillus sp. RRLNB_1_1]|uniref:Sel1 repeat family protein n=1 Tax=Limosilactobacillus albertensis TaxID=2759752 RepID=A0A7W3TQA0_9LACO|nr:tetratricopeptide repeat protein [Limosilactobacillus albertensis]MBB1068895.1 sel1 repeat family protein [Limosilactobacillus albertensis]MCD7118655.1 sel1 repeat family protein [Limosilactobacillus albertensis]MCD7128196.1 sel1 repeat family protein [Limosilactobacillus albertensis]
MDKKVEIQKRSNELLKVGAKAYRQGAYVKAEKYYQQSANLGNPQAACNLGYIYAYGRTGDRNPEKAFYYFSLASISGNANASYKVGDAYYWGDFVAKKPLVAYRYYQTAEYQLSYTESDDDIKSDIYYRLALCLFKGIGTQKDLFEALSYINQAHTYSYYDRTHDKFNWQSIAKKIENLRVAIISEFDSELN